MLYGTMCMGLIIMLRDVFCKENINYSQLSKQLVIIHVQMNVWPTPFMYMGSEATVAC